MGGSLGPILGTAAAVGAAPFTAGQSAWLAPLMMGAAGAAGGAAGSALGGQSPARGAMYGGLAGGLGGLGSGITPAASQIGAPMVPMSAYSSGLAPLSSQTLPTLSQYGAALGQVARPTASQWMSTAGTTIMRDIARPALLQAALAPPQGPPPMLNIPSLPGGSGLSLGGGGAGQQMPQFVSRFRR